MHFSKKDNAEKFVQACGALFLTCLHFNKRLKNINKTLKQLQLAQIERLVLRSSIHMRAIGKDCKFNIHWS